MITLYLVIVIYGITFSLIAILIGFLNFINEKTLTITVPIEVMTFLVVTIAMTAVCFRQLTFWLSPMFVPKLNDSRITEI